jgi:hypothetical protein
MAVPYPTITVLAKDDIIQKLVTDQDQLAKHVNIENQTLIFDFGEQPIGYLNMVSKNEGFVLAHPAKICDNKSFVKCCNYHFKYEQNKWLSSIHFLLIIPFRLLFDEDQRLYEGIAPFLFIADKVQV